MDLKTFIQTEIGANQEDPISNQVISLIQNDEKFPITSDIKTIAQHLYKTLNEKQTLSFQKLLMFWKFAENNYQQPTDPNLLGEINYIIDLQDRK